MKSVKALLLSCMLAAMTLQAQEISEVDQRWAKAVEKMIVEGKQTSISTPLESRVKLAKQLAKKHGREWKVVKTDSGFRLTLQRPS